MVFFDHVVKNRTIRRFDTAKLVTDTDLEYCLRCASMVASAGNLQRLRYVTVTGKEAENAFSKIALGGYLPPEKKPGADVAPTAYIVLTSENENPDVNLLIDSGISAEAISLAACELGIGACMIRNFNKEYFSLLCGKKYSYPILVIALGYPAEEAKTVEVSFGDSLKYYKNDKDVNIVPKLTVEELIVGKIR